MARLSILFFVALVVAPICISPSALGACIPSGTEASINSVLPSGNAVLCPGSVFKLSNSVVFPVPNRQMYTQGFPTGNTRALLIVVGSSLDTAIKSYQPGTVIKNIQVNGNYPALSPIAGGGALIEIGGSNAFGQVVDSSYVYQPRGNACIHVFQGAENSSFCKQANITSNLVGPAGAPPKFLVDGISLACLNSTVVNNTIVDVTDGGIDILGAPGSSIFNNTILSQNQTLVCGIKMVDYNTFNGNYVGTTVANNTIIGNSRIRIGIAMGPKIWGCNPGTNKGGTVTGNVVTGPGLGYGYPINSVSGWTVTSNVDTATHFGSPASNTCSGTPVTDAPPGKFQFEMGSVSGTLQAGYVPVPVPKLTAIIAVTP